MWIEHQASGSDAESFAAAAYLQGHDLAVRWAKANRELIAQRFVRQLGAEADLPLGRLPQQHHLS